MAARAVASGTLSFGLVSIPVKLYAATRSQTVRFNWLDPKDHARVKQQYVSAKSGEPVSRSELVRGYEYARDRYVVFDEDEFKALAQQSDGTIEIEEFLPIESVDPIYFEKSNLLGPDKGGAKAYRLLREAMDRTGRVAVGRFSTRGKQQLVLIRPREDGLILHGLYYADEVRSFEDVDLGEPAAPKKGELELAEQLIEQLTSEAFDAGRYEDTYRQKVLAAVDRKVAGEEIVALPAAEEREQILDLVAALKESLSAGGGRMAKVDPETSRKRQAAKKASKKKPAKKAAKAPRRKTASK